MNNEQITKTIQALEDFHFSLEDFFLNRTDTVKRATCHVSDVAGTQDSDNNDILVGEILKLRSRAMLSSMAVWVNTPNDSDSEISCRIEGRLFKGQCHIEPKRIMVRFEPEGLDKECVLLKWSPIIFTEEPFIGSPASRCGVDCAKDLFLELCYEALLKNRIFAANTPYKT